MSKKARETRLVYSTESGRVKPVEEAPEVVEAGPVRVHLEKKGRGGKSVSCIGGLGLSKNELNGLLKQLKKKCGSGGAVKDGVIEIQGDFVDRLVEELNRLGHKAKRSGG